jgi:excisionase family DNA binding protein
MAHSDPGKRVLTTGEVARICNVAPRTVSKWFDSGQLRGYRIPGSKDRRIPLEQLMRFMRAHGIPLNGLESGTRRVVVFDGDAAFAQAIGQSLTEHGGYEVTRVDTAFEAGAVVQEVHPHVLLVDVSLSDVDAARLGQFLRGTSELQDLCVIGMASGLTDRDGHALLQDGFDGYLAKPFEMRSLVALIESHATTLPDAMSL